MGTQEITRPPVAISGNFILHALKNHGTQKKFLAQWSYHLALDYSQTCQKAWDNSKMLTVLRQWELARHWEGLLWFCCINQSLTCSKGYCFKPFFLYTFLIFLIHQLSTGSQTVTTEWTNVSLCSNFKPRFRKTSFSFLYNIELGDRCRVNL